MVGMVAQGKGQTTLWHMLISSRLIQLAVHTLLKCSILSLPAGTCCAVLAPFLPAFCQQLLSGSSISWTRVCLDLLALLPLPTGLLTEAWGVLLMAAVQLQGPAFMPGEAKLAGRSRSIDSGTSRAVI
jgi:hypothetical protein